MAGQLDQPFDRDAGPDPGPSAPDALLRPRRRVAAAKKSPSTRSARLLLEAMWIVGAVVVMALAIVLATFSPADPGFTHSATPAPIYNAGGRIGAWLADMLLLLFGLSAWIWVAAGLAWVSRGLRRLFAPYEDRGLPDWLQAIGLAVLLAGATGLRALGLPRVHRPLPPRAGGGARAAVPPLVLRGLGFYRAAGARDRPS